MNKICRKASIVCAAAIAFCSGIFGAVTAQPNTALAEDTTMSAIIGKKTDNVTVTAGVREGDYAGLLVAPTDYSQDWSAEIDKTFTGNTEITYLLPEMATAAEVESDWLKNSNAFSVKNSQGETVATFFSVPKAWGDIAKQSAFFYNGIEDSYSCPYHHWETSIEVDYWGNPVLYRTLSPTVNGERGMGYLKNLQSMRVSPATNVTSVADGVLETGTAEGTLYFKYDNEAKTLSVETTTYDFPNRKLATQTGNGQIIPMGTVNVDLSDGYTIEISSAPDFGKEGDVNYFEFTHSSSVLITSVKTDGEAFDTVSADVTANAGDAAIVYDGEKTENGNAVIYVERGSTLQPFRLYKATTLQNTSLQTIALRGYRGTFAYAGNKPFYADETITVTHEGATKTYLVKTIMPEIDTESLFIAKNTTVTASQTAGANGVHTGVKLAAGNNRTVKINGTFYGSSNISYMAASAQVKTGLAWTLTDASGKDILTVVNFNAAEKRTCNSGRAYVYDIANDRYTTRTATGEDVKEVRDITDIANADFKHDKGKDLAVLPNIASWNGEVFDGATYQPIERHDGTLYFEYDEAKKEITVKITTVQYTEMNNTQPRVVTLGVVSADLSQGYTLESRNMDETPGNFHNYFKDSLDVYVTAINGVPTTGERVTSTDFRREVTCDNGTTVAFQEELFFTSQSYYAVGSLYYRADDTVTVVQQADVSKQGKTSATVSDWCGTYTIDFTVTALADALQNVEMANGGYLFLGEGEDGTDKGIGFKMTFSAEDTLRLKAAVGKGKTYVSVSYGMVILPYSYVQTNGAVTAESLFGDNALYTWDGKDGAGTLPVYHTVTNRVQHYGQKTGYLCGILWDVQTEDLQTEYTSVGYICLEDSEGNTEYVWITAENNVGSAYRWAKTALECGYVTNETHKEWLQRNYIAPCEG